MKFENTERPEHNITIDFDYWLNLYTEPKDIRNVIRDIILESRVYKFNTSPHGCKEEHVILDYSPFHYKEIILEVLKEYDSLYSIKFEPPSFVSSWSSRENYNNIWTYEQPRLFIKGIKKNETI